MTLPQLFLRKTNMDDLEPIFLPEGFALHNHIERTEENWENIIEDAFGAKFSFDKAIRNAGDYKPEYVLYVSKDGKDIATGTGVEKPEFPGEGWFRMIATKKEARGLGAGKLVCNACLHALKARGYKSVVLSTDDNRIPAIKLYLALGFEPIYTHESHEERWKAVMENINANKK